ncbi:uncharacterized protein VTP21DRAFT_350 [Calcarisporiella thermophila]|uniref:uncharacterized protein n=1 Tax=Calcarisporiella thermophila TaxID=911321 RepID=UPI0037426CF6
MTNNTKGYIYDSRAGEGTAAYIIDTGIYIQHPEFEGRASWGATFAVDGDLDRHGHGTHMAGIVGSKTYGVAKKTKLIAVKSLNFFLDREVIAGINWAAKHAIQNHPGKAVINISLVGGASNSIDEAVNQAVESGVHVAVAAGDHGDDSCKYSPGRASKVISVIGVDRSGKKLPTSNYGRCIHLCAPGAEIISTWNDGKTKILSGSSVAAPHVSGVIAYLLSIEKREPSEMKRVLIAICALAIPTETGDEEEGLAPFFHFDNGIEAVKDNYIVVFKEGSGVEISDQNIKSGVKHMYDLGNFKGFSGEFSADTLRKIRQNPSVKYVESDGIVSVSNMVTQPGAPWNLVRISHRATTSPTQDYVYDSRGGEGTTVYVIDTGIHIQHPEFEGRATWGATFTTGGDGDPHGHGTHVAGIVGSKTYGVAKKANLISVRVLDEKGAGPLSSVIAGINWTTNHAKQNNRGKAVVNCSFGSGVSRSVDEAVNNAIDSGLHFAVAAGNDNKDACKYSPAHVKRAVCVGSVDKVDNKAPFSNYGRCVDLYAPGVEIVSTWNNGSINALAGTSMSTPHVAGQMAVLLSIQPRDPSSMLEYLKSTATRGASKYPILYNQSGL